MSKADAAIAVFVKTPGLSPIKTRLAHRLGRRQAEEFYAFSIAAVEVAVAMVADSTEFCPYWAVAEENAVGQPRWQRFANVWQGVGGLGDRLFRVFSKLRQRHTCIVAIGGDSPQITSALIEDAMRHLEQSRGRAVHVLGRCHDGGFYLVGSNVALPASLWNSVPYSTAAAADCIAAELAKHGEVVELGVLTDVDELFDLVVLQDELQKLTDPSPEQLNLLNWTLQIAGALGREL